MNIREVQEQNNQAWRDIDRVIEEMVRARHNLDQPHRDLDEMSHELAGAQRRAAETQATIDRAQRHLGVHSHGDAINVHRHGDPIEPPRAQLEAAQNDFIADDESAAQRELPREVWETLENTNHELSALTFVMAQIKNELELQGQARERQLQLTIETNKTLQGIIGHTALLRDTNGILRTTRDHTAGMLNVATGDAERLRRRQTSGTWIPLWVLWLRSAFEDMATSIYGFCRRNWLLILTALVFLLAVYLWIPSLEALTPIGNGDWQASTGAGDWQATFGGNQPTSTLPAPVPMWRPEAAVSRAPKAAKTMESTTMLGSVTTFLSGAAAIPATREVAAILWRSRGRSRGIPA